MPNPFNVAAEIGYWLADRQYVTVKIYNLSGEEVATLVEELLGAGDHSVRWDGTDGHGRPLPSGTYVCRAQSGVAVDSRTIMLTR
jgi:flagellar hook assembly protein FlgD